MVLSMFNSIHVRQTDWNQNVDLIGYRMGGGWPHLFTLFGRF